MSAVRTLAYTSERLIFLLCGKFRSSYTIMCDMLCTANRKPWLVARLCSMTTAIAQGKAEAPSQEVGLRFRYYRTSCRIKARHSWETVEASDTCLESATRHDTSHQTNRTVLCRSASII